MMWMQVSNYSKCWSLHFSEQVLIVGLWNIGRLDLIFRQELLWQYLSV
jgi:hypothetical protein